MKGFVGLILTTIGFVGMITSIVMFSFGVGFRLLSAIGIVSLLMILAGTVIFAQIERSAKKSREMASLRRASIKKNRKEYLNNFKKA